MHMKKIYIALVGLALLSSCGGDDEAAEPAHEIGTWDLDGFIFQNFPAGYEDNEGATAGVVETVELYSIMLAEDNTYVFEIQQEGPDLDDTGTWTLENAVLEMESDDSSNGVIEWGVEKNESDDLWLSVETQDSLIPDVYYDTVTQDYLDYLDTLTDAELDSIGNALSETVTYDLVFVFERSER